MGSSCGEFTAARLYGDAVVRHAGHGAKDCNAACGDKKPVIRAKAQVFLEGEEKRVHVAHPAKKNSLYIRGDIFRSDCAPFVVSLTTH